MPKGKCAVADCGRQAERREWCTKHYQRWQKRVADGWLDPDPSVPMKMGPKNRRGPMIGPKISSETRNRNMIRAFKRGKPCMDCGIEYPPPAMEFDHRPGEVKLFPVGRAACSVERLWAEVEKCDLVCANCHAVRTWNRLHPGEGL